MADTNSKKMATRGATHFPDLLAIRSVADVATRLYALIGAAVSLAATGEAAMFGVYRVASDRDERTAAADFYRHVRFRHKRDLVDEAIRELQATGHDLSQWAALLRDAQRILGDGARNLVGHNPVRSIEELWLTSEGEFHDFVSEVFVEQNKAQVEASRRPAAIADEATLLTYCQHAMTLCIRLGRFAQHIRDSREQYRLIHDPG
jgi:hypothetical protein